MLSDFTVKELLEEVRRRSQDMSIVFNLEEAGYCRQLILSINSQLDILPDSILKAKELDEAPMKFSDEENQEHTMLQDFTTSNIMRELQRREMIKVSEDNTADITGLISAIRVALGVEMEYISKMLSEFRTSSIMRELNRRRLVVIGDGDLDVAELKKAFIEFMME